MLLLVKFCRARIAVAFTVVNCSNVLSIPLGVAWLDSRIPVSPFVSVTVLDDLRSYQFRH